jgi:RNA polymerase sigma factor (sigma-70 family)
MVQKSGNDATPTDDEIISQILDPKESSNPEVNTQMKHEYKRLHEAIDALPFKEQQAVKMKFFNGMKLEDIAKTLGTSRSSVKRYISQGEEMLRRSMKD